MTALLPLEAYALVAKAARTFATYLRLTDALKAPQTSAGDAKFPEEAKQISSSGGKESPNGEKVFSCTDDQITLIVPHQAAPLSPGNQANCSEKALYQKDNMRM